MVSHFEEKAQTTDGPVPELLARMVQSPVTICRQSLDIKVTGEWSPRELFITQIPCPSFAWLRVRRTTCNQTNGGQRSRYERKLSQTSGAGVICAGAECRNLGTRLWAQSSCSDSLQLLRRCQSVASGKLHLRH